MVKICRGGEGRWRQRYGGGSGVRRQGRLAPLRQVRSPRGDADAESVRGPFLALRERLRLDVRVRLVLAVAVLVGLIAAGLRKGLAKGFAERVDVCVPMHLG